MAKLSTYAALALGAAVGTVRLPVRDVNDLSMAPTGTVKEVTAAVLRTAILGGGTGFTASDPLVAGATTLSGTAALQAVTCTTLTATGAVAAGAATAHLWTGRAQMTSPADSVILLQNAAGSDFSMLKFGGTTSSFPALKRSSAQLQARLGDDSAHASVGALEFSAQVASIQLTNGATTDIDIEGTGATLLALHHSQNGTINNFTSSLYAITGRAAQGYTITLLSTKNGTAGIAFTIAQNGANPQVRITNTSGVTSNLSQAVLLR